jgi:glycosyltransferase involved in cell wall biosynthesis
MRLVIVQYAGDFREAANRIQASGAETYYAQKYSIDAVAALVGRCESVSVLCCLTAEPYDVVLDNGVRAIGAGFTSVVDEAKIVELTAALNPDRLILRTPMRALFAWAVARKIRTIGIFADAFSAQGILNRLRSYRWARLLNRKSVEWIFNHGLNSCLSLANIGVNPAKVIPWDWPAMVTPHAQPKKLAAQARPALLYVGLITEAKGIGDLLHAVARLQREGMDVQLKVAGGGDVDRFTALAEELGIGGRVQFLGLVAHSSIQERMRDADLVVVPSRHEYAEGFPMTIYETLCSRTPLIASDHPMFRTNLQHEKESLIFPAGDAEALAANIRRALTDAGLYERLSSASAASWNQLQLPVKWGDAIDRWLFDCPPPDSASEESWLFQKRLSSGIYPARPFPL